MARVVHCLKLEKDLPGLDYPPVKGELGQRIYENISAEAWKQWLRHSTMVINEMRLNPSEVQGQQVLREQMEKFFFGGGVRPPEGYKPPS